MVETVKVLLEAGSPIDNGSPTSLQLASMEGHTSVVEILIDRGADVEQRDCDGNNCLDLAIDTNNQETAEAIIKSDYWQEALRNHTIDRNTGRHDTPMRKLIRKMPDVAKSVFNRCMVDNKEHVENVDYEITFNYEFLDDMYSILNWAEEGSSESGSSSGSLVDDDNHLTNKAQPYTSDSRTFKTNHPLMIMMLQIYQAKLNYFSWENLIDWITYITALLTVIDFDSCQKSTGFRTEWQWNVGTVSIFLTWINLVLFMQKFPRFGIYVVMFQHILKTFFQFALVFVLLIVAFAMAFYALLQNQPAFETIWQALIKTTVMMIGEFEYTAIFIDSSTPPVEHVNYKPMSYIMFVIFMVIMSTILMNLLVGLAVDNIKEVQEQAELTRKAMLVELALDVERMVPDFIRRRFILKSDLIRPNVGVNIFFSNIFGLESYGLTAANINKALNPELDEIEKEQESMVKLKKDVDKLKASNLNIEGMMKAMLEAQDIRWQDEDFQESSPLVTSRGQPFRDFNY